ncbi:MAG TPA: hypothetical protein VNS52_14880 [Gemmatimonadaceae bacterium]|jgi:hypothetical protein|nr:hypothetical protein [Gemmatimonadaceae bacterium]
MNEKQLAALIRKNAAKAAKPSRARPAKAYDATLPSREPDDSDVERDRLFKEMKKREF